MLHTTYLPDMRRAVHAASTKRNLVRSLRPTLAPSRFSKQLASSAAARLIGIGFGSAATAVCVGLVLYDLIVK